MKNDRHPKNFLVQPRDQLREKTHNKGLENIRMNSITSIPTKSKSNQITTRREEDSKNEKKKYAQNDES